MADSMTPAVRRLVEAARRVVAWNHGRPGQTSGEIAMRDLEMSLTALDAPPPVTGKGEGPFDLIREWERTPNRDAYVATFIDRAYLAGQASATPPPPPVTDEDVERVALWCRSQIVIAQVLAFLKSGAFDPEISWGAAVMDLPVSE